LGSCRSGCRCFSSAGPGSRRRAGSVLHHPHVRRGRDAPFPVNPSSRPRRATPAGEPVVDWRSLTDGKRRFSSSSTCPSRSSPTSFFPPRPRSRRRRSHPGRGAGRAARRRAPSDISGTPCRRDGRGGRRGSFRFLESACRMVGSAARWGVVLHRPRLLVERDVEVDANEEPLAPTSIWFDGSSSERGSSERPTAAATNSPRRHAVREAPLVVVPEKDLHELAVVPHRGSGWNRRSTTPDCRCSRR